MKKILGRKGFTLVECIIAVAVFGLLSIVIFMILTNASVRATKASESEENLAQLIENVVGDDTYKKFDPSDFTSLSLIIDNGSSADFQISYNDISGYKNYIECNPSGMDAPCGHQANFTGFMSSSATSMVPVSSIDFDVATCFFVCPHCEKPQKPVRLRCPDCGSTGAYNASTGTTNLFNYMNAASGGGFECGICGSTAVMAVDSAGNYISEKVAADGFSVSGMVANGIRYGEPIDWAVEHTDDLANNRIAYFRKINTADPMLAGADFTDGKISLSLKYKSADHNVYTGEYELTLYTNPAGSYTGGDYNTDIVLPIGYNIVLNGTTTAKSVTVAEGTLPGSSSGKKYPILRVTQTGPGNVTVKFSLSSKETGYSFEYENNRNASIGETDAEQGLFRWFNLTPLSSKVDRDEMDCLKSSESGSQFILDN